jgi:hypothetical protein
MLSKLTKLSEEYNVCGLTLVLAFCLTLFHAYQIAVLLTNQVQCMFLPFSRKATIHRFIYE